MKVLLLGDVHCQFAEMNNIINRQYQKKGIECVFQCGDYGFWPNDCYTNSKGKRVKYYDPSLIKTAVPLYFCDGNHENHPMLLNTAATEHPYNVKYMERGSVLTLNNKKIMFIGGASSIDKNMRTPGYDWFPEEIISNKQLDSILAYEGKIDMIVSHTCPDSVFRKILPDHFKIKFNDPCMHALDIVFDKFRPAIWTFGHFHVYSNFMHKDTQFICLGAVNNVSSERCWDIIDLHN